MTGLSLPFYQTALKLVEEMADGSYTQYIQYPSAVIVLASTSLEAYINEILAFHHLMMEPSKQQEIEELRRPEVKVRARWLGAPAILGGKAFDTEAEPYKSFDLMVTLRNKLVHDSAEFRTPDEYPLAKIDEYKQRFAFTYEGSADWASQVLNLECARWGCSTAQAMVHKFHELTGIRQLYSWPDPA